MRKASTLTHRKRSLRGSSSCRQTICHSFCCVSCIVLSKSRSHARQREARGFRTARIIRHYPCKYALHATSDREKRVNDHHPRKLAKRLLPPELAANQVRCRETSNLFDTNGVGRNRLPNPVAACVAPSFEAVHWQKAVSAGRGQQTDTQVSVRLRKRSPSALLVLVHSMPRFLNQ